MAYRWRSCDTMTADALDEGTEEATSPRHEEPCKVCQRAIRNLQFSCRSADAGPFHGQCDQAITLLRSNKTARAIFTISLAL